MTIAGYSLIRAEVKVIGWRGLHPYLKYLASSFEATATVSRCENRAATVDLTGKQKVIQVFATTSRVYIPPSCTSLVAPMSTVDATILSPQHTDLLAHFVLTKMSRCDKVLFLAGSWRPETTRPKPEAQSNVDSVGLRRNVCDCDGARTVPDFVQVAVNWSL